MNDDEMCMNYYVGHKCFNKANPKNRLVSAEGYNDYFCDECYNKIVNQKGWEAREE